MEHCPGIVSFESCKTLVTSLAAISTEFTPFEKGACTAGWLIMREKKKKKTSVSAVRKLKKPETFCLLRSLDIRISAAAVMLSSTT